MIYEVRARLFFNVDDEAEDFYHDCEVALAKAIVINPGSFNQECSEIQRLDCHHDEDPNEPCVVVDEQDNCPPPPD